MGITPLNTVWRCWSLVSAIRFNKVTYREHNLSWATDSAVYYLWRKNGPFMDNPVLNKHAQPSCCINTTFWLIFLQAQTDSDELEDCYCYVRILTAVVSATWYSRMNKFNQGLSRLCTVHFTQIHTPYVWQEFLESISLIFSRRSIFDSFFPLSIFFRFLSSRLA